MSIIAPSDAAVGTASASPLKDAMFAMKPSYALSAVDPMVGGVVSTATPFDGHVQYSDQRVQKRITDQSLGSFGFFDKDKRPRAFVADVMLP